MRHHIGLIGLGYWGPNILRNLMNHPGCSQVSIYDKNHERLEKIKLRYTTPKLKVAEGFDEMMVCDDITGVVISTPINTHFELAKSAIQAKKHILVEKPIAHSSALAEKLCRLAIKNKVILMAGHTFLYSAPVMRIKGLICNNELGEIYYINSQRINLGIHQRDSNVIWDLAPHDISMLLYWVDEKPETISAIGRDCIQHGIPDVCFMQLQYASGLICNINMSWLAPSKYRQTIIVGNRKMLVYDDTRIQEKVKIYDRGVDYQDPETFGEYHLSYRSGDILSPHLQSFEPLYMEIDHFLECIDTGKKPMTDGEQGCTVVKILEAAEASLKKGGLPVIIDPAQL